MSQFYDILHGKTKMRDLSPVPDGVKFRLEMEKTNPLCKFHLDKVRAWEVHEMLQLAATDKKIEQFRNVETNRFSYDCNLGPPQDFYFGKMSKFTEKLPWSILTSDWETNIKNLVPQNLSLKYDEIFETHMDETKERYKSAMHDMAMQSVISKGCGCDWTEIVDPPYKLPGRTENYEKFMINRCKLMKQYFLPHKLMKNIFLRAWTVLPKFVCDFGSYRSLGFLDLARFIDAVETDMRKGAQAIEKIYYTGIVKLLSQPRYIHDIHSSMVEHFLRCATKLLAYQIVKLMMKSIQHYLDILSDDTKNPLLVIVLQCKDNALYTVPSIDDIHNALHDLLNNIASVAQKFPPLESWVDVQTIHEFIPIVTPSWHLESAHKRLDEILVEKFQPLRLYLSSLHEQFGVVYDVKTHNEVVAYVAEEQKFEDCLARLQDFNNFILDINGMTGNEYFTIGKLYQEEAKIGLKMYTEEVRELIIGELVKRHRNLNLEICGTFEELKKRCLNIPTNTKELLDLGEYMLYANTKLMDILREKIELSLYMMSSLLEMTSIDRDHIELNNDTVNWLNRIKPILEQNSSLYEQMKYDLEEQLQSRAMNLQARIEEMFPRLIIMDDMDDETRIREYIEEMRKFIREMDRMEEAGEWINQEERLFKFPITPYPKVRELKEIIMPFYTLIYRAYQWQRDCGVWLDGPFEYLDANIIDSKTTDYLTDFSKTGKTYKTKIKMHTATSYPYSFAGSVDDPDPFQHPAPMKLCFQLLENVKWFKPFISLASCFCNRALRQRHWDEMSEIANFDLTPNAGTTLRKMINMDLMGDLIKYELISISATRELALQELLAKMIEDWDEIIFITMPFKDSGVTILTQLDDIEALLEEHIVKMQAMRGSAFVKPIENEVRVFYDLLIRMQTTIEEWAKVQVQWMYLLPIFSSKDIVSQLPEEGIMFQEVDGTFRRAMQIVSREPRVRETAGSSGLFEAMREANELLEKINEGVTNYLEKKRLFFPRFFFLSNEDMLEILSETKDPLRVQPHLKKCFEGIAKLGYGNQNLKEKKIEFFFRRIFQIQRRIGNFLDVQRRQGGGQDARTHIDECSSRLCRKMASSGRGANGKVYTTRNIYELFGLRAGKTSRLGQNLAWYGGTLRFTNLLEHGSAKLPDDTHGIDDRLTVQKIAITNFRHGQSC